ncbi:MAG: hypothetical protein IKK97_05620 [Phascolarctobacterium sp.]|nr:hypothetical protein [Phascolarctobacterium sp.]
MVGALELIIILLLNSIITVVIAGFMIHKALKQLIDYYYDDKLQFGKRIIFLETVIGKDEIEKRIRTNGE